MITRIYATDTGAAWGTRTLIWRSDRVDDTTMAYAVQCSTEVNKAPTLKFAVGPEHPYYYLFKKKKTILTVTEDSTNADDPDGEENNGDACLFRGCVQELEADIYQQLTVTAEGALLYLEDSLHVPTGKNKRKVSRRTLMQSIIDDHNAQMTSEPEKQFTLGTIGSFQGKMDRVGNDEEFSDTSYETNMSFFSSHVKDECNGYLRVRYNRNFTTHYLDFLEAYGTEASQHLRFAVNIEDISHEDVSEDLYTVLVPVGKNAITLQGYTGETTKTVRYKDMAGEWQEVTVRVNGKYLEIPDAIEKYGYIYSPVSFSDKGSKQALLDEALDHIGATYMPDNFTLKIKAINLRYLDNSVKSVRLGDKVSVQTGKYLPVVITDQNVNPKSKGYYEKDGYSFVKTQDTSIVSGKTYFRKESIVAICSAIDFDFSNPENTEYTIGTKAEGLTSRAGGGGGGGSSGAGYGGAIHECIGYIQGNKKIIDGEILEINTQITTIGGGLTEAQQQLISQGESITAINTDILAFHDNFVMTTTQMQNEYTSSIADLTSELGVVQTTTSELGNSVADVLVAVHEITGSQIIQDAEHISNFVGTWHEYTDYSTDPPTVSYVYQGGGGLFIEQNNVQFGIWHEGNLTGGMMVEMINNETVTHINGDVIDLQSNRLFTSTVSAIYGDYSRIEQEVDRISLTVSGIDDRYSQIEQTMSSIALTVSDYREGFSQIQQTVSQIALTVSDVDGRFSRIENTVSRISLTVQETVSDFSRIETTVSHIRSTVSSHDGRFSQIESTVSSITATVSAHDGRFSQIETTVSSITLTVSSHDGRFSQIENTVSSISLTVSGYEGRMSSIEQYEDEIRIFVGDTTGRFSLIDQQIDSITATVQETEEQFSQIEQRADSIALQVTDLSAGYSLIEQKVDSITSTVADNEDRFSQIEQRVDSITLTVAENEGRFSAIEQTAGSISLRVTDVESSYSEIRTEVDSITLRVEDTEGNYSQIRQTTNEITAAVHDLDDNYAQLKITSDAVTSTVYGADGLQSKIEQMSDHVDIFVDNFEDENGNFTTSGLHIGQSNLTFGVYTTGTATGNNRELTAGIIVNKVNAAEDDPDVWIKGKKIKIGDSDAETEISNLKVNKLSADAIDAEYINSHLTSASGLDVHLGDIDDLYVTNHLRISRGGAGGTYVDVMEGRALLDGINAIGDFTGSSGVQYSGNTVTIPFKRIDGSTGSFSFNRVSSVTGSWADSASAADSAYEVTVGNTSSYLRTIVGTEFTNPANNVYYIQAYYQITAPSLGSKTSLTSTSARKQYALGNTGDGTGASTTIQIVNASGTKYSNTPTMQLFLIDGQDGIAYLRRLVGSEYVTIAQRQIQGQVTPSPTVGFDSLVWNNGVGTITLSNDEQQTFTIAAKATDENGSSYPVTASSSDKRYGTIGVVVQSTGSFGSSSNIKGTGDSYTVLVDATENYEAGWSDSYNAIAINPSTAQTLTPGGSVTVYARGKSSSSASVGNKVSVQITADTVKARFGADNGQYYMEAYTNSDGNSISGASLTYKLGLSGSGSSSVVKIFKSDGTTQWPYTESLPVGSLYDAVTVNQFRTTALVSDSEKLTASVTAYPSNGIAANAFSQNFTLEHATCSNGTIRCVDMRMKSPYPSAQPDGTIIGRIYTQDIYIDGFDAVGSPNVSFTEAPSGASAVYGSAYVEDRINGTPTSRSTSISLTLNPVSDYTINNVVHKVVEAKSGTTTVGRIYVDSAWNSGGNTAYVTYYTASESDIPPENHVIDFSSADYYGNIYKICAYYTKIEASGRTAVASTHDWAIRYLKLPPAPSYSVTDVSVNAYNGTQLGGYTNNSHGYSITTGSGYTAQLRSNITVSMKVDGVSKSAVSYMAAVPTYIYRDGFESGWGAARGRVQFVSGIGTSNSSIFYVLWPSSTANSENDSVTAFSVWVNDTDAYVGNSTATYASVSHNVLKRGWNNGGDNAWATIRAATASDNLSTMSRVNVTAGQTYIAQPRYQPFITNSDGTMTLSTTGTDSLTRKGSPLYYFTVPTASTPSFDSLTWSNGVGTILLDNGVSQTFTIAAKATNESNASYPVTASSSNKRYGTIGVVVQSTGRFGTSVNIKGIGNSYTVQVDATENYNAGRDSVSVQSISAPALTTAIERKTVSVTATASNSQTKVETFTLAQTTYGTDSKNCVNLYTGATGKQTLIARIDMQDLYTLGIDAGKPLATVTGQWNNDAFQYWNTSNKLGTIKSETISMRWGKYLTGTTTFVSESWNANNGSYTTYAYAICSTDTESGYRKSIAISGDVPYKAGVDSIYMDSNWTLTQPNYTGSSAVNHQGLRIVAHTGTGDVTNSATKTRYLKMTEDSWSSDHKKFVYTRYTDSDSASGSNGTIIMRVQVDASDIYSAGVTAGSGSVSLPTSSNITITNNASNVLTYSSPGNSDPSGGNSTQISRLRSMATQANTYVYFRVAVSGVNGRTIYKWFRF